MMSPFETAQACTETLHKKDLFAQCCGMTPESEGPSKASVSMLVDESMSNGLGSCHGGVIFTLADTAFSHACNNENKANVAMDCRIDFLLPAYTGDRLIASAVVKHQGKRSSLYEVVVVNQDNQTIALFLGRSYYINKSVLEETE